MIQSSNHLVYIISKAPTVSLFRIIFQIEAVNKWLYAIFEKCLIKRLKLVNAKNEHGTSLTKTW